LVLFGAYILEAIFLSETIQRPALLLFASEGEIFSTDRQSVQVPENGFSRSSPPNAADSKFLSFPMAKIEQKLHLSKIDICLKISRK